MMPSLEGPTLAIQVIVALIVLLVLVALVTHDPRRRQVALDILRMFLRSNSPHKPEQEDDPPIPFEPNGTLPKPTLPKSDAPENSNDRLDDHNQSPGTDIHRNP